MFRIQADWHELWGSGASRAKSGLIGPPVGARRTEDNPEARYTDCLDEVTVSQEELEDMSHDADTVTLLGTVAGFLIDSASFHQHTSSVGGFIFRNLDNKSLA